MTKEVEALETMDEFSDEENSPASSEDNINANFKNEEEEFEIPAFLRKQKF